MYPHKYRFDGDFSIYTLLRGCFISFFKGEAYLYCTRMFQGEKIQLLYLNGCIIEINFVAPNVR
jgi:hypothetical protein